MGTWRSHLTSPQIRTAKGPLTQTIPPKWRRRTMSFSSMSHRRKHIYRRYRLKVDALEGRQLLASLLTIKIDVPPGKTPPVGSAPPVITVSSLTQDNQRTDNFINIIENKIGNILTND